MTTQSVYYLGTFIGRLIVNPLGTMFYPSIIIISSLTGYLSYRFYLRRRRRNQLKCKINLSKNLRNEKIKQFSNLLQEEEKLSICNLTVKEILYKVKNKKIKIENLILPFIHKIIRNKYNLFADVNFDQSLKFARIYDSFLDSNKDVLGIPVAINNKISIKNTITDIGYADHIIDIKDSNLTKLLLEKGILPLVKGNVTAGGLHCDIENIIWGRGINIINENKCFGLGEIAMVRDNLIPLAISLDISGEMRISSSLCGVCSFKLNSDYNLNRNIHSNNIKLNYENGFISQSIGLVAKTVEDISIIYYSLFEKTNTEVPLEKQRIGICYDYSFCETSQCIKDAIDSLFKSLNDLTVVRFNLDKFDELLSCAYSIFANFEYDLIKRALDLQDNQPQYLIDIFNSRYQFTLLRNILHFIRGNLRINKIESRYKKFSREELVNKIIRFNELKEEFIEYYKSMNLDFMVTPVIPIPSVNNFNCNLIYPFNHFTFFFNIVNFPVLTLPVKVLTDNDNLSYSSKYKDRYTDYFKECTKTSKDSSISVQIAALPGKEKEILKFSKLININNVNKSIYQY